MLQLSISTVLASHTEASCTNTTRITFALENSVNNIVFMNVWSNLLCQVKEKEDCKVSICKWERPHLFTSSTNLRILLPTFTILSYFR